MKGLVSTPFLWISAPFFTHRLTSVTPDISFPCVPPKIATLLAALKHTLLLYEDMTRTPRTVLSVCEDTLGSEGSGSLAASRFKCLPWLRAYVTCPRACCGQSACVKCAELCATSRVAGETPVNRLAPPPRFVYLRPSNYRDTLTVRFRRSSSKIKRSQNNLAVFGPLIHARRQRLLPVTAFRIKRFGRV